MQKTITTEININAKTSDVWNVLMDFTKYPEWNPFVTRIKGVPTVGEHLDIQLPGMKFKPIILRNDENEIFQWKGKLLFKGLFDGTHSFRLEESTDGSTTFIHSEDFEGLLVSLFSKKLDIDTRQGFIAMNEALKKRVEEA